MAINPLDTLLDNLGRHTFDYFRHEVNEANGLVADRSGGKAPASIAATGMGLSCIPIAVERGWWSRQSALKRTLATLRFFANSEQNGKPSATGYKGFYYHFLDLEQGRRTWKCELSTLDTALLVAGMLTAARYFDADTAGEREARELAQMLYERVDWNWARAGGPLLTQGWKPGLGFLPTHYQGYDESLLMHVLALGSPSHPVGADAFEGYTSSYEWKEVCGQEHLVSGPLFIHQLSHAWIDFRGVQDDFMRAKGCDYFENSRRATLAQREYAARNPFGFRGYGEHNWGLSACDGPGNGRRRRGIDGVTRQFWGYKARGVPDGPDDGTLAPRAVIASLPFAPGIILPAIEHYHTIGLHCDEPYGCRPAINFSFPTKDGQPWVASDYIAIDEGTLLLQLENYRSGLVWELMRGCEPLRTGLQRAGFRGGWLEA